MPLSKSADTGTRRLTMMFEPISPQELLSSLRDARLPYQSGLQNAGSVYRQVHNSSIENNIDPLVGRGVPSLLLPRVAIETGCFLREL